MSNKPLLTTIVPLSNLENGQEADFFALLTAKEPLTTRDGKPYFKVGFRDSGREVSFPLWQDTSWFTDCRDHWSIGAFYKLRAVYRETNYGPQLEIRKIRETVEADAADGFDPQMLLPRSRFSSEEMFDQLLAIARDKIQTIALRELVVTILETNREPLLTLPAATRNHHAYVGGYLEHVLCVTKNCLYLAERYDEHYPDLEPKLNRDLVVAGGILHDIGKLRELDWQPQGPEYTAAGSLVGHILQGRDIVREAAAGSDLHPDVLLRLEHIIVSHQRLPEWGSPKPPMTPEALLVHYADDIDAKYHMMYATLRDDTTDGPLTSKQNPLYQKIYRGQG